MEGQLPAPTASFLDFPGRLLDVHSAKLEPYVQFAVADEFLRERGRPAGHGLHMSNVPRSIEEALLKDSCFLFRGRK